MTRVPEVTFHTRVRDESIEGPNPYRWQDVTTADLFAGKRVVVFSLPGAFTPTCSTYQLPGYDAKFEEFQALGIDEVYCLSVPSGLLRKLVRILSDWCHIGNCFKNKS